MKLKPIYSFLFLTFGLSISALLYLLFAQVKSIRFGAIILLVSVYLYWTTFIQKQRQQFWQNLLLVCLAVALFSFLIYYD